MHSFCGLGFLFGLFIVGERVKVKTYKHGHATWEKLFPSGMYLIQLYMGSELRDKVRCDDYRMALDYWKSFNRIAKTGGE